MTFSWNPSQAQRGGIAGGTSIVGVILFFLAVYGGETDIAQAIDHPIDEEKIQDILILLNTIVTNQGHLQDDVTDIKKDMKIQSDTITENHLNFCIQHPKEC